MYRSERESSAWKLGQRARERLPHRYREVELRALAPDASSRLAESVAGAPLPPEVAELVTERSGGNPFFIEEAIRDLVERDVIATGPHGLELRVDLAEVSVPVAVQTALQARLGRLSPAAREVATLSAAVGRAFGIELLEKLVGDEVAHSAVLELQRLDLITEERRRPSPEYRFRHGLVQEVAYASLLEHDRHEAHGRIAKALQELAREANTTPPAPVLARHLAEADMPGEAADALIVAGDRARDVWATAEAVDNYRRARTFLARLGDEQRSRETLFKIALVHHVDFDFRGAERAYDEAFACKAPAPDCVVRDQRLRTMLTLPPEVVPGYAYVMESAVITDLLFRGLLTLDRDMSVIPSLAENLRVSSDGTSYLFQLHDGLRWSDDEPLTTHDFAYTWERIRELELPTAFLLDDVSEVIAHDDRTLEVVLSEPRNAFLYVLAHSALRPWPRHVVERLGPNWRTQEMVTNGPFKVAEMDSHHLLAVADPNWLGASGNVGELEFSFVPLDQPPQEGVGKWVRGRVRRARGRRTPADSRRFHRRGRDLGYRHLDAVDGAHPAPGLQPAGATRDRGGARHRAGGGAAGKPVRAGSRFGTAAARAAGPLAQGRGCARPRACRRVAGRGRASRGAGPARADRGCPCVAAPRCRAGARTAGRDRAEGSPGHSRSAVRLSRAFGGRRPTCT